jgi:hypothetical protein
MQPLTRLRTQLLARPRARLTRLRAQPLARARRAPVSAAAHRSYLKGYLIFEIAPVGMAGCAGCATEDRHTFGACSTSASPVPHEPLPYPVESHFLPNLIGRESLSTAFRSVQYAPFAGFGPGVAWFGATTGCHWLRWQRKGSLWRGRQRNARGDGPRGGVSWGWGRRRGGRRRCRCG